MPEVAVKLCFMLPPGVKPSCLVDANARHEATRVAYLMLTADRWRLQAADLYTMVRFTGPVVITDGVWDEGAITVELPQDVQKKMEAHKGLISISVYDDGTVAWTPSEGTTVMLTRGAMPANFDGVIRRALEAHRDTAMLHDGRSMFSPRTIGRALKALVGTAGASDGYHVVESYAGGEAKPALWWVPAFSGDANLTGVSAFAVITRMRRDSAEPSVINGITDGPLCDNWAGLATPHNT